MGGGGGGGCRFCEHAVYSLVAGGSGNETLGIWE